MKYQQAELDNIVKTIVDGYKPQKIYLFGSMLDEIAAKSNDIDLLIIIKKTDDAFYKRPLHIHKLFNPYLYKLDIHVYTPEEFELSKNLINTIPYIVYKKGRLLYGA